MRQVGDVLRLITNRRWHGLGTSSEMIEYQIGETFVITKLGDGHQMKRATHLASGREIPLTQPAINSRTIFEDA